MTETTEGLTRRMSSGSDSPWARAVAARQKKRATSASHGGSLRINIWGAFFSKRGSEPETFKGPAGRGSTGETQLLSDAARFGGVRPLCRDSRRCQQLYVKTVSGAVL